MESLLSLSFDHLTSYDAQKIRKGLRQLEGLLAQICLSQPAPATPSKRRPSPPPSPIGPSPVKDLAHLKDDPAFREFFKLQDGFEWNVASRVVGCLEHLLGKGSNGANDLLIVSALSLLHGVLLIHPPSRVLFARETAMNLLLDLLEPYSCPAIQSSALLVLVNALLNQPANTRTFENLDGLLTVTSLFKSKGASREVKMRSVEFLYFYLMPEGKATGWDGGGVRGIEEKTGLLGRYLSNVEDLVEDLRESAPFGAIMA